MAQFEGNKTFLLSFINLPHQIFISKGLVLYQIPLPKQITIIVRFTGIGSLV